MNREQFETVAGVLAGLVLALLLGLVVVGLLSSCERVDPSGLGDPVPLPLLPDAGRVPPAADSGADLGASRPGNEGGTSGRQDADTAGDSLETSPGSSPAAGGSGGNNSGWVPDAGLPPSFQTQAAECDPVTGVASGAGGARCPGGKTCEFACPPAGPTARPTCTGETFDGRSCAGGPCGWTSWSTGTRRYLGCAYGSSCHVPADAPTGSYLLPAGDGTSTTRSDGVCRTYCAGDGDCGGAPGSCDHSALPCAPDGTGLCPEGPPRTSCERV